MAKFWCNCVVVLLLAGYGFTLPQGRGGLHQEAEQVHQEHPNLDPAAIDEGMNTEHAKLIENLQRLKRTLDHVKERVGKGAYGEQSNVDMKNPEGAILTVLKSLQEQGQLFSMINDMLKAGSQVQNQTARIQAYSDLQEHARAEAAMVESTNQLAPASTPTQSQLSSTPKESAPPTISSSSASNRIAARDDKADKVNPGKHHGYDDYQYQYRDDSKDATGDDQYDYHYDASGSYDEGSNSRTTTTTTTTTRRPARRVRTRGRNDYY